MEPKDLITPLVVDDNYDRAAYLRIQKTTEKLNEIFDANIAIQDGYFLSEIKLEAGKTAYKFPTQNNGDIDNTVFPLSYGVNANDIFVGTRRLLTIDNRSATTATDVERQTYVNKLIFTAANTTTVAHLKFIFNSIWSYKVGKTTFIQNKLTFHDLIQPVTQQSSATNWPSFTGSDIPKQVPYMLISGKGTNYLDFRIQNSAAFAGEGIGGTVNILSWYMEGQTLENAAGFMAFYTGRLSWEIYESDYLQKNKGVAPENFKSLPYNDAFAAV